MNDNFEYVEQKLYTYLEQLAYSLVAFGYSVGGQHAIPGWDKFVSDSENSLIEEMDYITCERDVDNFLDEKITDMFYDHCDKYNLSDV